MKTYDINSDTIYKFKIRNFSFDCLDEEELIEIFKDGRYFSPFIESYLTKKFPDLTKTRKNSYYDFTDNNRKKYDAKTFTKNGCYFRPSNQIGQGRKLDIDILKSKCDEMTYILVCNVYFPKIYITFIRGCELFENYKSGKIPYKDIHNIFDI